MNRRRFIRSVALGSAGAVLVPQRSRAVALEVIVGGFIIVGGFYAGWQLSKWAKQKLYPAPVPPVPPTNAPPYFPTNTPPSVPGRGFAPLDCAALEALHDVSDAGFTSPVDGAPLFGYARLVFQRSVDLQAWSDWPLEVWFNARWCVLKFGESVEQASFMGRANLGLVVPPVAGPDLWRAKV